MQGPLTPLLTPTDPTQRSRITKADVQTRTAALLQLRVSGRSLGRGAPQDASGGWEAFRRTKAIDRKRHHRLLSVQEVISFRTAWAAYLSPRLSSRNRSTVEGA